MLKVSSRSFICTFVPISFFICRNYFVTFLLPSNLVMVENLVAILINIKNGGINENVKNLESFRDDKMYLISEFRGAQLPQKVFLIF